MKEKKNNLYLIVIIILVLTIALLVGYIISNKMTQKDTNKTTNEKQEQAEVKDMSLDEANQILEKFGINKEFGCTTIVDSKYNDIYKALVAINNLDSSLKKEEECSKYYTEELEEYIPEDKLYQGHLSNCLNTTTVINYDDVNKVYKKLFNEEMPKASINAMNIANLYFAMYYYDSEKNIFIGERPYGVGGTCYSTHIRQLKSAKVTGNTLKINLYDYQTGYINTNNDNKYHFRTNGFSETLNCSSQEECANIIKTQHMNKLPEYQVTFEKINGDYVFKNLIRVLS